MNIYTSETEYLKTQVQRLSALVRAQQITIEKLEQALAQPEQEPVAYINVEQRKLEWAKYMTWNTPTVVNLPKIPLYTTPPQRTDQEPMAVYGYCPQCGAKGVMRERRPNGNDKCANGHTYPSSTSTPPQRKPLTDAQIESLLVNWPEDGIAFFEFARAIEAAHGIQEDK